MVAKAEKKEKLDYMIDKMQRILAALEEIRNNDVTETAVLKKYGLDHKTFRSMVYDHDWDAATRVDGRKKKGSAEKVEGVVPTRSWAEDLFVEVYRIKDCSIPIPDDVTERLTEVISELPGDLSKVMFMLYRDGMRLVRSSKNLENGSASLKKERSVCCVISAERRICLWALLAKKFTSAVSGRKSSKKKLKTTTLSG